MQIRRRAPKVEEIELRNCCITRAARTHLPFSTRDRLAECIIFVSAPYQHAGGMALEFVDKRAPVCLALNRTDLLAAAVDFLMAITLAAAAAAIGFHLHSSSQHAS